MATEEPNIGRRVRELRTWRRLSITAAAGLAGLSTGYLSRIERGLRRVERRSTVEALASALRVAPAELTGRPFPSADPVTAEMRAALADLELALAAPALGEDDDVVGTPWPQVRSDLDALNSTLRPEADYVAQSRLLPGLIADLQAALVHESRHRRAALVGLVDTFHASEELAKTLGAPGLPALAASHAQTVAEELGEPAYLGLAAWVRGMSIGTTSRERMLAISRRACDDLRPHLDASEAGQVFGALQLSAALASAVRDDGDAMAEHLGEASRVAATLPDDAPPFGLLYFGRHNVGIWRVTLAVEHGEPGRARELARDVDPGAVPSRSRQAMFHADLGRGLATERSTQDDAVVALRRAEEIAPIMTRNNYLVRETVIDLVRHVRSDTAGREIRGMAHRMGIAG